MYKLSAEYYAYFLVAITVVVKDIDTWSLQFEPEANQIEELKRYNLVINFMQYSLTSPSSLTD